MGRKNSLCFGQMTDLHVGSRGLNPREAEANLRWALEEMAVLGLKFALVTGDLICGGTREELLEYRKLVDDSPLPLYALPANHDLWGEPDTRAWEEIVGPLRRSVTEGDLKILLLDDVRQLPDGSWRASFSDEQREWLEEELSAWSPKPCVVAFHVPILSKEGEYHDLWRHSNADEFIRTLKQYHVLSLVTGHWHRNGEWEVDGIPLVTTGPLCGWQWTGIPPHLCFPVRPGYRIFDFDGERIRSFWRDGSYWTTSAPKTQVSLVRIGPAHTGGPRPQVRPVEIFFKVRLLAQAFALEGEVEHVEWSLHRGQWFEMRKVFDGLWSEWEGELDPQEFRLHEEGVIVVRAFASEGRAYDAVPIRICQRECSAGIEVAAQAGGEMSFELFYPPD